MALLDEAAGLAFVSPLRRRELRAERTAVVRAGRRWLLQRQEAARALGRFPDAVDVMPTRLGNVLRRHERFSGAPFGLEATTVIPYVALVGDPAHRAYLDDMRGAMDLSVRLTLAWAICCGAGIVMLWPYDVWLVLPLSAYLLAWLSYRGAVAAAAFYGGAMALVIALGRRSLYDKLGVGLPRDTESERYRNFDLVRLLRGELSSVPYEWGASAGIPDSGPVETDPLLPSDAYLP